MEGRVNIRSHNWADHHLVSTVLNLSGPSSEGLYNECISGLSICWRRVKGKNHPWVHVSNQLNVFATLIFGLVKHSCWKDPRAFYVLSSTGIHQRRQGNDSLPSGAILKPVHRLWQQGGWNDSQKPWRRYGWKDLQRCVREVWYVPQINGEILIQMLAIRL